jgi:hypothetical protein
MSKQLTTPTSRLICLGDAKDLTNAIKGSVPELDDGPEFD